MKRTTMMVALAALALAAAPLAATATDIKLAVIDVQKALNATKDGAVAREALAQKFLPRVDALKAREKELKDISEKRKSSVLSKEAKAALDKDMEKKAGEYQEYAGRLKFEMDRENQAASIKIGEVLLEIARKICKDEGYSLLFERSEGGVLYAQESFDLTDRVAKAYNEKPPAGGEKKP